MSRLAISRPFVRRVHVEPLRILFCGSDDFSCASLQALHDEHRSNPSLVESIDVVSRPGKMTGRGMKELSRAPIWSLAEQLGLPMHSRDTFTGWTPPASINLIVAVSFGLLVPPRLLDAAAFGGLNVHPSLLPDLRGPAPIHHAMLRGDKFLGVSLQTLHPKTFDHGVVLAQTPMRALYRMPQRSTPAAVTKWMAPKAADMLVQALCIGLHAPPHVDHSWTSVAGAEEMRRVLFAGQPVAHAPKIRPVDRQLVPPEDSSVAAYVPMTANGKMMRDAGATAARWLRQFPLRQRVIGPLWFKAMDRKSQSLKRVIIESATVLKVLPSAPESEPLKPDEHDGPVLCEDPSGNKLRTHIPRPWAFNRIFDCGTEAATPPHDLIRTNFSFAHLGDVNHEDGRVFIPIPDVEMDNGDKSERTIGAKSSLGEYFLVLETLKMEGEQAKPARAVFAKFDTQPHPDWPS